MGVISKKQPSPHFVLNNGCFARVFGLQDKAPLCTNNRFTLIDDLTYAPQYPDSATYI